MIMLKAGNSINTDEAIRGITKTIDKFVLLLLLWLLL